MTENNIEENAIVAHARRELDLMTEEDQDFKDSLLESVKAFTSFGHSGGSASVAIHMLQDLLTVKNLSPLTNDPEEWMEVEMQPDHSCWQSRRRADAFTYDPQFNQYYTLDQNGAVNYEQFILFQKTDMNPLFNTKRVVSEGSNG